MCIGVCVGVCVWVSERDRETERQSERERCSLHLIWNDKRQKRCLWKVMKTILEPIHISVTIEVLKASK